MIVAMKFIVLIRKNIFRSHQISSFMVSHGHILNYCLLKSRSPSLIFSHCLASEWIKDIRSESMFGCQNLLEPSLSSLYLVFCVESAEPIVHMAIEAEHP